MPEIYGFNCYSPGEIAEHIESVGVTKDYWIIYRRPHKRADPNAG